MNIGSKSTAVLAASLSIAAMPATVQAGATQALSSCKKQIFSDERMTDYEKVTARLDTMQRRGGV